VTPGLYHRRRPVAKGWDPGQPGRLADHHGTEPGDQPHPP
jgi:hypothetical protein